ncbi:polymorphic toxin-type HINT domain-containing protein [Streptomyces sp. NPDC090132]|uniref:polymorphic toxin-type HINT domain-containing protein n=1 Tax=Streptomyces sp. NPDC090132 TaxID=3365955 RepID=UPI0037FF7944
MRTRTSLRRRALRRRVSLLLSGALAAGLIPAAVSPAQAGPIEAGQQISTDQPVKGERGSAAKPRAKDKIPVLPATPPHTWPKTARETVALNAVQGTGTAHLRRAGATPVSLAPAAKTTATRAGGAADTASASDQGTVTTEILGEELTSRTGVKGLLFTLTPDQQKGLAQGRAGSVSVGVDYASFAGAYGGSYASRLRLVEYPACVLTSPEKEACRKATPVASHNDTQAKALSASAVSLSSSGPTVLAAEADAGGAKGDFKASSLSDAASWSTNLSAGDFSWSYDFDAPGVPGGLEPSLKLSYSSGSIDGRTSNTNNQGSWIGDGFDLAAGSIERRYQPCADDGEKKNADGNRPGDVCWDYDNAFLTFNGKGGELVPTGTDTFKLQQDDGTRIKRLRSMDRANGDNDGEYWELTDPSGTRYYFGYNRLPGYTSGKEATNSVYTVPVFGNNVGEPCHKDDFASSYCDQAWRWNLDYVVDPHGNVLTYHYTKETNSYGRNLKDEDDTRYVRGGYLYRIDYGLKSDKVYADKPLAQVVFSNSERCLPQSGVTCGASTIKDKAAYWYDTPWDLNCDDGAKCDKGRLSPSFWTRKRLTGITTQVLQSDGSYGKVDSYALDHKWGMADTDYQLLLKSIQHTGHSESPAITLPKTTFAYTQLANRLDKTGDGYAPFIKSRLSTVDDEMGSQVDVAYSGPGCQAGTLPKPETNTTRCYPQYLDQDPDATSTEIQWFNKYVTSQVTVSDRTGGAADMITRYEYTGPAAWHYNDSDGMIRKKYRTWDQWRGYGQVRTLTGGSSGMKSQEDAYFLRGMDGDRKDTSGGTKSVAISLGDGEGEPITDASELTGFSYRTVTYDKPGGKVLRRTVSRPWYHETAKKVRDWGAVVAAYTAMSEATVWTSLDDGAGSKWRTTKSETKYDTATGRVTQVNDLGDTSTSTDDACTRTTYVDNASANILNLTNRVETVAKACSETVDYAKDVIGDVRTAYDNGAYGAAPTKGEVTATATLKSYSGTKATYLEAGTTYDAYGRPLAMTDLTANLTVDGSAAPVRTARTDGRKTSTVYSPATGFPTKVEVTTPPAKDGVSSTSLITSQKLDPLRGQPVTATDPNGKQTVTAYDALGRSSQVWLADRKTSDLPSYEFTYQIADGKPTAIGTRSIGNNDAQTKLSYTLYDGLLRPRQTQSPGPEGGTIVADTFYDDRGLVEKTFASYFTTGAPVTALFLPDDALSVESQTRSVYDGLGRATQVQQIAGNGDGGTVLNTTKTIYHGDRTTVIPPVGGTASTAVTDAQGRTTQLRQLHQRDANADADVTAYRYNPRGQLDKVTDPAGNEWAYTFDQQGRQTAASDPDTGTTHTFYDDRGQVEHTTDARGASLYLRYDGQGRQTQLREGSATGTLRAEWTYDTLANGKGLPASTTRYENGEAYTSKITFYDALGRALRQSTTIPDVEGKKLAGTYQSSTTYARSGLVSGTSVSAAGGLAGGGVTYTYDDDTLWPTKVSADNKIAGSTTYTHTGLADVTTITPDGSSKTTQIKNTYDWGTRRLGTQTVSRQDQPGIDRNAVYHYDEVGNITSVADTSRTGTDNQCYIYDYLSRLTEAWAQSGTTCSGNPGTATLGGPAPYWQSFAYDLAGNRTNQTQHDLTGQSGKNTETAYTYPAPGTAHGLKQVDAAGPSGTSLGEYAYDKAGNTTARPGQTLTWDAEGHLASVAEENGDKTSYLYDPDGNRLIARTPTETTIYLGTTELTLAEGADKPKATRYSDLGAGITAVQADDGTYSYTIPDHQGTGQLAINADTLAIQQRRTTPFGEPRGTTVADWPGTKGFVGGTDDTSTTGLQHLGAREYDPTIGRFISVDPLMDLTDPQQINGYAYGNNNPATLSDPDGLRPLGVCGFSGDCDDGMRESFTMNSDGGWDQHLSTTKDHSRTDGTTLYTEKKYTNGTLVAKRYITSTNKGLVYAKLPVGENRYLRMLKDVAKFAVFDPADLEGCTEISWSCGWILTDIPGIGKLGKVAKVVKASHDAEKAAKTAKDVRRADADDLAQCAVSHSFLVDTKVELANGETKSIQDVRTGDVVLATDPETGKTHGRKITATIVTEDDKKFTELSIRADGKNSELTATDTHPFWSPNRHAWIDAGDLRAGDLLRTLSGTAVTVAAIRRYTEQQRTYDLTVERTHTYYVLAGDTPVLVHNSNCGIGRELIDGEAQYHIISGNKTGGGHKWPGQPGKSVFPANWSTDEILDGVAEVAANPNSKWDWVKGPQGSTHTRRGAPSRVAITGVYDGVDVKVIYEPASDRIISGYPYK